MLVARAQRMAAQIDAQRERTDAVVAGARDACTELTLRRGILAEQLDLITKPLQLEEKGEKGDKGGQGGDGKMQLSLNTASVGMDGIGGTYGSVVGEVTGGRNATTRTKRSGSVNVAPSTRKSLTVTTKFG
jgi:hypothetical protein